MREGAVGYRVRKTWQCENYRAETEPFLRVGLCQQRKGHGTATRDTENDSQSGPTCEDQSDFVWCVFRFNF